MMFHQNPRFVSRLTRSTLALILAGGRGTRLKGLTRWRVKPAVPFGGKFRIIDFPLSNCLNSGIRQVGILTQYKSHSLIKHLQQGWSFLRGEFGEFIEILPAQQRIAPSWYSGTADAVYQNLDIIRTHAPEFVLILAGDHVYKMDYGAMIARHVETKADMTVACIEVDRETASRFGIMSVDEDGRVKRFTEKPKNPDTMPGNDNISLASMGIYIFSTEFLYEQIIKDADLPSSSHDFGRDIIPSLISKYRVMSFPFKNQKHDQSAYWRDVGTVDSFWEANMELVGIEPELNMYDIDWPIWTYQEQLPPAKFVFNDDDRRGMAVDSMISGGCVVSGASIIHSLLFSNVHVSSFSVVENSVILPDVTIGRNCQIKRAVIDKGCKIPENTQIGLDLDADKDRFLISENNIRLVTPESLGQELHHVR